VDHGVVEDLKGFDNLSMKVKSTNFYYTESQKASDSPACKVVTERYTLTLFSEKYNPIFSCSPSLFCSIIDQLDIYNCADAIPVADDEASEE